MLLARALVSRFCGWEKRQTANTFLVSIVRNKCHNKLRSFAANYFGEREKKGKMRPRVAVRALKLFLEISNEDAVTRSWRSPSTSTNPAFGSQFWADNNPDSSSSSRRLTNRQSVCENGEKKVFNETLHLWFSSGNCVSFIWSFYMRNIIQQRGRKTPTTGMRGKGEFNYNEQLVWEKGHTHSHTSDTHAHNLAHTRMRKEQYFLKRRECLE